METKEELVNNIKKWIKIDTEINELKKVIKEYNNNKKLITESLVNVMKKNEIDTFDINNGSLIYKKNVIKKPINSKTLLNCLNKFYSNKPEIAEELAKFILDNREIKENETIKMKINK